MTDKKLYSRQNNINEKNQNRVAEQLLFCQDVTHKGLDWLKSG